MQIDIEPIRRKNQRIRKAIIAAGIDQGRLSQILGISETECSMMLKRELAKSEQDLIIDAIKAATGRA